MEGTFKDSVINDSQHDKKFKKQSSEERALPKNLIRRCMVKLEKFYDLHNKFKKVTNGKKNSSSIQYEVISLGTESKPQNIKLGSKCTLEEKESFIKLFQEYKDVFSWTYVGLKTFDTKIMQHVIQLKECSRPLQ
jgi:hypothetical protein